MAANVAWRPNRAARDDGALHAVKEYNVLIYGLTLMVALVFFPQGLFPGIAAVLRRGKIGDSPSSEKPLAMNKGA